MVGMHPGNSHNIFYLIIIQYLLYLLPWQSRLQDMAKASGVPVVVVEPKEGWHRACGNGMIVPNVGMAMISVLACVSPKPKFQASVFEGGSAMVLKCPVLQTCFKKDVL